MNTSVHWEHFYVHFIFCITGIVQKVIWAGAGRATGCESCSWARCQLLISDRGPDLLGWPVTSLPSKFPPNVRLWQKTFVICHTRSMRYTPHYCRSMLCLLAAAATGFLPGQQRNCYYTGFYIDLRLLFELPETLILYTCSCISDNLPSLTLLMVFSWCYWDCWV